MSIPMYCITRNGERIAGSLAVPQEVAMLAAMMLNKEHRRRDLFTAEVDPTATEWEENQSARHTEMLDAIGDGALSEPVFASLAAHLGLPRSAPTC